MVLAAIGLIMALAAADPPATDGSTTAATTPASEPATPPAKPKKDPSKKVICEETPVIGSSIPRRVCHTKAEWDARARDDQQELRRVQDAGGNIVQ
jgi:hypothetical protein